MMGLETWIPSRVCSSSLLFSGCVRMLGESSLGSMATGPSLGMSILGTKMPPVISLMERLDVRTGLRRLGSALSLGHPDWLPG